MTSTRSLRRLLDDHADARTLRADASADRIEVALAGSDGDLGTLAGLAGDGLDLDQAVIDFGNLDLEQAADQVGMGARNDDRGALMLIAPRGASELRSRTSTMRVFRRWL